MKGSSSKSLWKKAGIGVSKFSICIKFKLHENYIFRKPPKSRTRVRKLLLPLETFKKIQKKRLLFLKISKTAIILQIDDRELLQAPMEEEKPEYEPEYESEDNSKESPEDNPKEEPEDNSKEEPEDNPKENVPPNIALQRKNANSLRGIFSHVNAQFLYGLWVIWFGVERYFNR